MAGGGSHSKAGGASAPKEATVKVPDPNASRDPKIGHQAGVGDDPGDLNVADPDTGTAGSGGRQAHATR